jgi:hypothetical protein
MTSHLARIKEIASEYRVDLDAYDVLVSAERPELIRGESLNRVLAVIETTLTDLGRDDRTVESTKNVVLELAVNTLLHGTGGQAEPELLVVSHHGSEIAVWMFGRGRQTQIERLRRIIESITRMAVPPKHREILLKRRNRELVRRSLSPASKEAGGGTGMIIIAALSSQPLWFLPNYAAGSFALRSTI